VSCRQPPGLIEFAQHYARVGGFHLPTKRDAKKNPEQAVKQLASDFNSSCLGARGGGDIHWDYETGGNKVTVHCPGSHGERVLIVYTTQQLAAAVLGLIAEPPRQEVLL
jgi:hypothetical protein